MAAQDYVSCSFKTYCSSPCGLSSKEPHLKKYVPLVSCKRDITSHLTQLKVARLSVKSERELILARAGLFTEEREDMTICPLHRATLGLQWRPTRKCNHPLHGLKINKPERGITLKMSKEITLIWHVLVPVGSGTY